MPEPATRPRQRYSLRAYLLALVAGVLLPAILLTAFLLMRIIDDHRTFVEAQLIDTADAQASAVDSELAGVTRGLQALALSHALVSNDLDAFVLESRRLLESMPLWRSIAIVTPDGRTLATTLDADAAEDGDRDSLTRVFASAAPVIGNLSLVPGKEPTLAVRVPIRDAEGLVVRALTAFTTPDRITRLLRNRLVSDEWVRGIVDNNGVLIARSRDPERFVGEKGTPGYLELVQKSSRAVYRDVSLEGRPVYGAFSRSAVSGWTAGVAVPASVLDGAFQGSITTLVLLSLVLLGLGGGGAFLTSRAVSGSITAAAEAAADLAERKPVRAFQTNVIEADRLSTALARASELIEARELERDEHVARAYAARAEAEAANSAKDNFLAMLGHELRNPLAPALSAVQLSKIRGDRPTAYERDVIERQIRHLARLVDDLLDVARLRRGELSLNRARFDMIDAVNRAVEMTSPLVADRQHKLTVSVPRGLFVDGDELRLTQVIVNLLTNAVKYTERGGLLVLRARADNRVFVFECEDNGAGLSAALRPRLFLPFVQGDQGLDRQKGGLGLGLAVAKAVVEAHGGSLEARSEGVGQGSTFVMRLPLAVVPEAVVSTTVRPREPGAARHAGRVLVVDDNPDSVGTLVAVLSASGFDAVGVGDAPEACDLFERAGADVAILDIGLPTMSGYDLVARLRTMPGAKSTKFVALTGYGQDKDVRLAREAGFDLFLVKPVTVDDLLAHLSALLDERDRATSPLPSTDRTDTRGADSV